MCHAIVLVTSKRKQSNQPRKTEQVIQTIYSTMDMAPEGRKNIYPERQSDSLLVHYDKKGYMRCLTIWFKRSAVAHIGKLQGITVANYALKTLTPAEENYSQQTLGKLDLTHDHNSPNIQLNQEHSALTFAIPSKEHPSPIS